MQIGDALEHSKAQQRAKANLEKVEARAYLMVNAIGAKNMATRRGTAHC